MPALGHGTWPPASPWIWQDSWYDANGAQKTIVLTWRFDDTVTGGSTLALQGLDYDVDPACPWRYLIIVKPDGTRITHQIPAGGRTGTISAAVLATAGLSTFTDLGSTTVGATPN